MINSIQQASTEISVASGAGIGLELRVGVAALASLSHQLFGGESLKVWIVETANDAINLTVAGAILAFLN